jgi:hypothetical protein
MRSAEELPVAPPVLLPMAGLAAALPSVVELVERGRTSMAATVALGLVGIALAPWFCIMPVLALS